MTDDARKSAHSMDETELADCVKIGETYYCQQVTRQMDTIDAQCESQLFMKQLDKIKENCEVDIAKAGKYASDLESHRVLVIGTKENEVPVTWKSNNVVNRFSFPTKAITMITPHVVAHAMRTRRSTNGTLIRQLKAKSGVRSDHTT